MNKNKIFKPLAASNHTKGDRPKDDFYATEPRAAELLLEVETFNHKIWECACGTGHLAQVFTAQGYDVRSSDIIDRGYGDIENFLEVQEGWAGDIITNPPYKHALEFAEKALEITQPRRKSRVISQSAFPRGKTPQRVFPKEPAAHCLCISVPIKMCKERRF